MPEINFFLRAMEWERVKGGLNAILASYGHPEGELFCAASEIAAKFIVEFGEKSGID